jgi:hypothetical protein
VPQALPHLLNIRNAQHHSVSLWLKPGSHQIGTMPPVRHGSLGLSPQELFGQSDTGRRSSRSAEAGPSTARTPLDAAVAQRISLASLRAETQQLASDEMLARGVRHRWLTWAREEKGAKPLQAVPDEALAKVDELYKRVPPAFRCVLCEWV